ncbi:hypothetical protein [Mucilaginibacter panaciglaebae]|uniref:DoxX family membrane protein n=1 Tax=Mucilaginibacter panaciglaebae TaxID=502331 RepID=A0ABP7X138_9SPHI
METSTKNVETVKTVLKLTYGLVPIVAGADKFTNLLTDWSQYLHPAVKSMLPFSDHIFMMIVGIIEVIAGILVLTATQKGAYLVSIWLVLIALNLVATGSYLDVAVRDIVMAIGAFSLAKLSTENSPAVN